MDSNYWRRFTESRIGRRRMLATLGTTTAAAAFLAACGGDDDDDSGGGGTGGTGAASSGLLTTPKDQTSTAKRGGANNVAANLATSTYEQTVNGSGSGGFLMPNVYSTLMRQKLGTYDKPPQGETEPEFAQSYEVSDGGLTVTFKLRGMKFDDRPPTSGRVSDSGDVAYSWKRWETSNPRAPELANSRTPDGPVLRVETPDAQTAVFKLAFPFAPFTAYMSSTFFPFMYPKEAETGFDTRRIARGTGAFVTDDTPGATSVSFTRNPNYYDKTNQPYFDTVNIHNLPEYTAIYSQFRAGALDYYLLMEQEDVLAVRKSNDKLIMYQRPFFAKGSGGVYFGRRQGSPFNDDRVRKALSLNLDRKLWGDTYSNRDKFEAEGLPVETKWHAGAGPGYHWYLDPEKNELGDASKNLQYNPAEAKKMLQATGMTLPIRSVWQAGPAGTGGTGPRNDGMVGLFQQSGDFVFSTNPYATFPEYLEKVRNTGGDFDGIGLAFYNDHHDFDWTMMLKYHPKSTDFWMRIAGEDPKMTDFVNRQRRELDQKKREQIFQDFVKYDVGQMYYMPHFPADWQPYYVGQPWVGGFGWHQPYIEQYLQGPGQWHSAFWFDASKKSA